MAATFDVIWVGTGQATMSTVPRLLEAGKKVAVVESGLFGGTCVNTGCTPTKTLVAAAKAISMAKRGDDFGFSIGELDIDFPRLMTPQKNNRVKATGEIENYLQEHPNCAVYKGRGVFSGSHTIDVNGETLRGEHIVLNTGTRPRDPDVAGADTVSWLNNESLLDLEELPAHLGIVGGGYISLEFAQIFRRLGSDVTVLERGDVLLKNEDEDVSAIVAEVMASEGINVICNSGLSRVAPGVSIDYQQGGEDKQLTVSHLMFAIGRVANTDQLNLAAAGLEADARGFIAVNEQVQTGQPHIYAVGDINGRGAFTHTSVNDGEIFWDHYSNEQGLKAADPELDRTLSMRTLTYAMFVDPPLARVGMSEKQARLSERSVLMATLPMSAIGRAREKQETQGIVKLLVDAENDQFLGATVFGTGGDEVVSMFAALIQAGVSWKTFRRTVLPHPTVSELMTWALDKLEPLE